MALRPGPGLVRLAAAIVLGAITPAVFAVEPPAAPVSEMPAAPDPTGVFRSRLEALTPVNADAYFELGEEVADLAPDPAAVALARRLYVLAFSLDRAGGGQRLAGRACLALAAIETNEKRERWLKGLAGSLETGWPRPQWVRNAEHATEMQRGYDAAVTLGLVRSGAGIQARGRLGDPGIMGTLLTHERLLSPSGDRGGMRSIEREAGRWPCPECHNQRLVKKGSGKDAILKLCLTCGGNPGPKLNIDALTAQLRFESHLLRGIQRSWAAQVWSDRGMPLHDPEPEELAKTYGVEPARVLYRGGRWVEPNQPGHPVKPPNQVPDPPSAVPPGG